MSIGRVDMVSYSPFPFETYMEVISDGFNNPVIFHGNGPPFSGPEKGSRKTQ